MNDREMCYVIAAAVIVALVVAFWAGWAAAGPTIHNYDIEVGVP